MTRTSSHTTAGRLAAAIALALIMATGSTFAVPPHPSLIDDTPEGKARRQQLSAEHEQMLSKGICSASSYFGKDDQGFSKSTGESPMITGPFRILAIVVEFTDHAQSVPATFFDSLMFSSVGNTVRSFYSEISYTQLDLLTVNMPSSLGWQTAPQTYAYYVDGQKALGSYPNNSQKLIEDLVDLVDPLVDFSQYDNDGDGWVDLLLVIHSGTGAEFSGSVNDVHSHKWGISPRTRDGVVISDYTIQPEFWAAPGDMTIGVYAHELGHGFGLPDLYDIDNTSNGIGYWGLMSYGSWNGPTGFGESPAHPCAWSKIQMGFVTATNITGNTNNTAIASSTTTPQIFRLWNAGGASDEYFLVENRQQTGSDTYLPGSGLLIWHIDDSKSGNTQEWWPGQPVSDHYLVALEQADGLFEMEQDIDFGDAADPFPGSGNNTAFNAVSSPSSNAYSGDVSFVGVDNISVSADTMYADLIVGLAAGIDDGTDPLLPASASLSQNYPNPFNPTTTIALNTSVSGQIQVEVFNILGQKVRTLIDGVIQSGISYVTFDAVDDEGQTLPTGVYFYRLVAGEYQETRKMVFLK